jgi:hypothetical protein
MSKSTKEYKLTAIGGNRYPSLEAAQAAALEPVAQALAIAIRKGLEAGELVVVDGKVVIPESDDGD